MEGAALRWRKSQEAEINVPSSFMVLLWGPAVEVLARVGSSWVRDAVTF